MAKALSTAYVEKLNAQHSGGVFLRALAVTETLSPLVIRRYVAFEEAITFDGQVYEPLHMEWSGLEVTNGMSLPTFGVSIPAAHDEVMEWAETFHILEHDCRLLVLHLDLLNDATAFDQLLLQIQAITANYETDMVTFTLGLNLGLRDLLPRGVILKQEFTGTPDGNVRILS